MNSPIPEELQRAEKFIREKNNLEAVPVLVDYLRHHPTSEEAWFLLSFAVPDLDDKTESLEQVLKINPDNQQAKGRLQKLLARSIGTGEKAGKKTRPGHRQPTHSRETEKKRSPLVWILLFMVLCIVTVAALWWANSTGMLTGIMGTTPTPTEVAVLPENTEAPSATADPPTLTAIPPTETHTPTPTQTNIPSQTPTATLAQAGAFLADTMGAIEQQVIAIRGLESLKKAPRYLIPVSDVKPLLESIFLRYSSKESVADKVRVLTALGLTDQTYDLYTKSLNNLGDSLGGFYDPNSDQIFVIGTSLNHYEQWVYSHEYAHALVDQHYDLGEVGVYPLCKLNADRCLAIRALVEGDAMLVMSQWLETYTQPGFLEADPRPTPSGMISSEDFALPFEIREYFFLYGDGLLFADTLYQINGWNLINDAYKSLPLSTEQILHPQKFIGNESPVNVPEVALDQALGEDWRLVGSDVLGELGTQMVLAHGDDLTAQLDLETTRAAAAGWGGDRYQVYYNGKTNQLVLGVRWVWDFQTDAIEFMEAMTAYLEVRYRGNRIASPAGVCWQLLNDHVTCIYQNNRKEVLWLRGPDLSVLEALRGVYGGF